MSSFAQELVKITEQGVGAVLATVVEADGSAKVEPGAKCLIRDGKVRAETIGNAKIVEAILRQSDSHARSEKSQLVSLTVPE